MKNVQTGLGEKAKIGLITFVQTIGPMLGKWFESEITASFGFNERQRQLVKELLLHAKEHNARPAKRIRAAFVYYGYLLGGGTADEKIWRAAMAIELIHTALLMHDDFMDEDKMRRGGPTTNQLYEERSGGDRHYGEAMAVNIGDGVLCLGFRLLLESGFPLDKVRLALDQLLTGISRTAYGQAYDVSLQKFSKWTEDDVVTLHKAKTAIYTYENPLFIGGLLTGLPNKAFGILHDYAMDGGVAFQLQDDILGVFGDEEKTGKSADSDLLQGKNTLLVLKALELGTAGQKKALLRVWGKKDGSGVGEERILEAKVAILESGSLDYSQKLAKKLARRAVVTAGKLSSLGLKPEAIDFIKGVAQYMADRDV